MPIGSMTEAETILAAHKGKTIPAGWKEIGSGEYRTAYLSPTGVVYKIERGFRKNQSNRGEYERILELRYDKILAGYGAYIPKAWLYECGRTDVIAMEYVTGASITLACLLDNECKCGPEFSECGWDILDRVSTASGLTDLHRDNVVFIPEQNRVALIDLGA